jgi:hypothetical protein
MAKKSKKFRSGQKVEFKKKYLDVPKGAVGYFNYYRGDGRGDGGCEVEVYSSAYDHPLTYRPDPAILTPTRKAVRDVVLQGSTATTRSRTMAKKNTASRPSKGKRINKSTTPDPEMFGKTRDELCSLAKGSGPKKKKAQAELKRRNRVPSGPDCGKRAVSK